MGVPFAGVPFAGRPAAPRDILAARKAALLFVLGTMVGGALTRGLGFGASASPLVAPLVVPLDLLASDEAFKGFPLVELARLGREVEREGGREGLLWTEAADAGRVGGRPPSRELRDDARDRVDAWRTKNTMRGRSNVEQVGDLRLKEEGGGAASLLTRNSALRFVRG